MAMAIYYFTGTGNSLYVARTIAKALGDSSLVNMALPERVPKEAEKSDVVGFVFPVYFWGVPPVVQDFIRKLEFSGKPYVFGIATMNAEPGVALYTLDRLLREKGQSLSAGYTLVMPGNAYLILNKIMPLEARGAVLAAADARLTEICGALARKSEVPVTSRLPVLGSAYSAVIRTLAMRRYRVERRFYTTGECNGCGACRRICPDDNIKIEDQKVTWGDNCVNCLACFHWCPQAAVQIDKKSPGIARYHHPAVKIRDMYLR